MEYRMARLEAGDFYIFYPDNDVPHWLDERLAYCGPPATLSKTARRCRAGIPTTRTLLRPLSKKRSERNNAESFRDTPRISLACLRQQTGAIL